MQNYRDRILFIESLAVIGSTTNISSKHKHSSNGGSSGPIDVRAIIFRPLYILEASCWPLIVGQLVIYDTLHR